MAAAVVIVEPDRHGTHADQLEVQVGGPTEEVTEEAPIAIDLVETGIRLHADGRAGRDQAPQERPGLDAIALASAQLRVSI